MHAPSFFDCVSFEFTSSFCRKQNSLEVYLPSLPDFGSRLLLMFGVLVAGYANAALQARLIPHATFFLDGQRSSFLARFGASLLSALLSLIAAVAATLLAGFLQGWLQLPK
jgi:hypothetical protein